MYASSVNHCHTGERWFQPIELLVEQMDSNNVGKAVLIQHREVYDNSYLLDCANHYPNRFKVVAIVDTVREDALFTLEKLTRKEVIGVRLSPGNSRRARVRMSCAR